MPRSVASDREPSHRVISEMRPEMAKAHLTKSEVRVVTAAEIGACLDEARRAVGFTLDQLAGEFGKDSKQVGRWIRGEERTQIDVVFGVVPLRKPFVIALANLSGEFQIQTTLIA